MSYLVSLRRKLEVGPLEKEIEQLKTQKLVLIAALEFIRAASISRADAVDDATVEFIEQILTLEAEHEKS